MNSKKSKAMTKPNLPAWANEPLKFRFNPDAALRGVLTVKPPKDWKKALRAKRKQ